MEQSSNSSRAEGVNPAPISTVIFREIHKNAWLKKLPSVERRTGAFSKKGDRVWVVFCVHDDAEAFLETYYDQKLAITHKPDWCVSLNNCLHISPTICAQEEEFEFVVTLSSDLVRLTAPSWDTMMEWVEAIRSKLREMKILSPRENIYSKMPEARLPLAPTRDPNSPLPPPPAGPTSVPPGIESTSLMSGIESIEFSDPSDNSSSLTSGSLCDVLTSSDSSSDDNSSRPLARGQYDNVSLEIGSSTTSLYITQSEPQIYPRRRILSRTTSVPDAPLVYSSTFMSTIGAERTDRNAVPEAPHSYSSTFMSTSGAERTDRSVVPEAPHSYSSTFMSTSGAERTDRNVTVIEVSNGSPAVFDFNISEESPLNEGDDEAYYTPPLTPAPTPPPRLQIRTESETSPLDLMLEGNNSHYECVFLPRTPQALPSRSDPTRSEANRSDPTRSEANRSDPTRSEANRSDPTRSEANRSDPTRSEANRSDPTRSEAIRSDPTRSEGIRSDPTRSEGIRSDATRSEAIRSADPLRIEVSERVRRRRSSSTSEAVSQQRTPRCLQPAPHPYRQQGVVEMVNTGGRLTLREQQVMQLRREMLHPGGVRLQLRRKDCTGSIALIDAFGGVWISGWKQREHPMLYNALHIGDQLLSTAGVSVQTSADAHRMIRAATSLYVEFVIRRVPFGRVFAIGRETEGQSLGLVQEGNTAVIKDVVQGGLAARHGLSAKVQTCDGLSLTSWTLTEINGRPLNLFFKENEIRDRLNAVGRDISILVQPFDLVKQLKKQLKSLRSYKDYIVQ